MENLLKMFNLPPTERLPIDQGWGVLYLKTPINLIKEHIVASNDDGLTSFLDKISDADQSALADFYDATVNRVFGLAMKIVLRPELAEEVVNDVYLQVWKQACKFDPQRSNPIAWLLMICRSRALDKLRREKSATKNQYQKKEEDQDQLYNIQDENAETAFDDIIRSETSSRVTEALKLLNSKQLQAISLAFYQGMSHQEIANCMGEPLGTIKSNIRRAQDILRKGLGKTKLKNQETGGLYEKA